MSSTAYVLRCLPLIALLLLGGCLGGDGDNARLRLLNTSTGYDSLDVYVNNGDDDSDTQTLSGVGYGTLSAYSKLKGDTYTVKFKRNGSSSTLETLGDEALADESHTTYVAYGASGHFATVKLSEDESDPDSGESLVRILNISEGGNLDVYLTESSDSLDDSAATASDVATGATSDVTMDSSTYRLRVTGAGDSSDLRLDLPSITVESKQVVWLILTSTQGGVLVDMIYLPQQGEITSYPNTKARVRGAVGISNGSSASASIGGTTLLTSAVPGTIGNSYVQVESGSAVSSVSVDGTPVSVPNQTLAAGGDYTFLVWNDSTGTRTTLLTDDNHIASSAKAKIRLVNAQSALSVPLTLSIDYAPYAEAIATGSASAYSEISSGSDYQLDITNSDTTANLLSRNSVTLQGSSVYTYLISGSTTTVTGTLRKDR